MTVYVDDMKAPYRTMIMCHMIADSEEELLQMVDKIGVQRRWHQYPDTVRSHFDICLTKKALAVKHDAVEITSRELVTKIRDRRQNLLKK